MLIKNCNFELNDKDINDEIRFYGEMCGYTEVILFKIYTI